MSLQDLIILSQKCEELEAKNGELETWKNKAKEKMPSMQMRIHELEAKNVELVSKIEVLEFHLNEIATSDLVASNLRCMAKHALNNKNG